MVSAEQGLFQSTMAAATPYLVHDFIVGILFARWQWVYAFGARS
jgi:hypothetical protein